MLLFYELLLVNRCFAQSWDHTYDPFAVLLILPSFSASLIIPSIWESGRPNFSFSEAMEITFGFCSATWIDIFSWPGIPTFRIYFRKGGLVALISWDISWIEGSVAGNAKIVSDNSGFSISASGWDSSLITRGTGSGFCSSCVSLDESFLFTPKLSISKSWILSKFDSMNDSEPFNSISSVK